MEYIARHPRDLTQTPEWKIGQRGETLIRTLLMREGFYVIPSTLYSGAGAPAMHGDNRRVILPDFDVARSGCRRWAEVKSKREPSFFRGGRVWNHGISRRHWEQYCRVIKETGTPGWLFIYEGITGAVLYQDFRILNRYTRTYSGELMDPSGMVFWHRATFWLWGYFDGEAKARSVSIYNDFTGGPRDGGPPRLHADLPFFGGAPREDRE
jgi:hypothetical protein